MQTKKLVVMERAAIALMEPGDFEKKSWWMAYGMAKHLKETTGVYVDPVSGWASKNRRKWEDGKLSAKQILALREIEFPFLADNKKKAPQAVKADTMDRTIELHKKFQDSTQDKKGEEWDEYFRNVRYYASIYDKGKLSEKNAARLGLC